VEVGKNIQNSLGTWPVLWISGKQPMRQVPQLVGVDRLQREIVPSVGNCKGGLILERMSTEHQGKENATKHPNIYLLRDFELLVEVHHLWRSIHHSSILVNNFLKFSNILPVHVGRVAALVTPGAEIAKLKFTIGSEENILNL